jgi:hypothetical protein
MILSDLETLLNNNDHYKQKGKNSGERSAQSPVVTLKNTTSRSNAPATYPVKKSVNNSSSGGGDKNPPSGKIESSHKLPVRKKRKTPLQEEENNLLENDIQSFSLEDMELEADIEKIEFPEIEQQEHVVQQNTALEVVGNESFSEEESFTIQSVVFDKDSKKLILERNDQRNKKGKSCSEVDLKYMRPSQISKIHKATGMRLMILLMVWKLRMPG